MKTNRKYIILSTLAALVMLISSCGQAGFDATVKPADVTDIDLSSFPGTGYVIKKQAYVETGNFGIDLSRLTYKYTFKNTGNKSVNIEVRLSLYGDDETTPSAYADVSPNDGYIDNEKTWLTSTYRDTGNYTISNEGYGWVSMIGKPGTPLPISAGATITNSITIENSEVINHLLKQKGVWIDIYVSPEGILPTSGTLDLTDQSIEVEGSKTTGYFPGAF